MSTLQPLVQCAACPPRTNPKPHPIPSLTFCFCLPCPQPTPSHFLISAPAAAAAHLRVLWSFIMGPFTHATLFPRPSTSQHVSPSLSPWPTGCPPTPTALQGSPADKSLEEPPCKKNLIVHQTVHPFCPHSQGTCERAPIWERELATSYSQPRKRLQAKSKGQGSLLGAGFQRPRQTLAGTAASLHLSGVRKAISSQ